MKKNIQVGLDQAVQRDRYHCSGLLIWTDSDILDMNRMEREETEFSMISES